MIRNEAKKLNTTRLIVVVLTILVLLGVAIFVLEKRNVTHFFGAPSVDDSNAQTTSKLPTAQSDFSSGEKRDANTVSKPESIVTDNNGNVGTPPPANKWTQSQNGTITVYTPTKDAALKSGDILSGATTTTGKVAFRLNDNVSGMIATGTLDIVNGKFSGKFDFSTTATEGRVDVFSQAADGTESNHVSIPVRF